MLLDTVSFPSIIIWQLWCVLFFKLDGVVPVDNRPSTNKLHHFVLKNKNETCDKWHVTCDTWHVTWDMLGGWTFSQNFSSLALTICYLWYYEDLEEKDDLLTELMNYLIIHEAVYGTGPATPGLVDNFDALYPCMCVCVYALEHAINKKLDGVAPSIADPPLLKLNQ